MTLGTVVHRGSGLLRPSFTRQVSSKATPGSLPPQKLRALVSLYHQSKDFITPNNLDERIDAVFAHNTYTSNGGGNNFTSRNDLVNALKNRQAAPRIGEPTSASMQSESYWQGMAGRERQVLDALYGTDNRRPGLDVLLDEEEKIKGFLRDDKESLSQKD